MVLLDEVFQIHILSRHLHSAFLQQLGCADALFLSHFLDGLIGDVLTTASALQEGKDIILQ